MKKTLENIEDFFLKILEKVKLKKLADLYKEHREGMRYLVFGVLSTMVNIVSFAICSKLIFNTIPDEQRVNISNAISIVAAVIFAYVTNKLFVFETKANSFKELLREIGSFISCRVITALIDMLLMQFLVVTMEFNEMLIKIAVQAIVILVNFILSKLIIFKKNA